MFREWIDKISFWQAPAIMRENARLEHKLDEADNYINSLSSALYTACGEIDELRKELEEQKKYFAGFAKPPRPVYDRNSTFGHPD